MFFVTRQGHSISNQQKLAVVISLWNQIIEKYRESLVFFYSKLEPKLNLLYFNDF